MRSILVWAPPRHAQPVLYVVNAGNDTIGEYNAATGATTMPRW